MPRASTRSPPINSSPRPGTAVICFEAEGVLVAQSDTSIELSASALINTAGNLFGRAWVPTSDRRGARKRLCAGSLEIVVLFLLIVCTNSRHSRTTPFSIWCMCLLPSRLLEPVYLHRSVVIPRHDRTASPAAAAAAAAAAGPFASAFSAFAIVRTININSTRSKDREIYRHH